MALAPTTQESRELRKHAGVVNCASGLSHLQGKISNVLLHRAFPNLLTKRIHEVPVNVLMAESDYDSKDVGLFKDALEGLRSIEVRLDILDQFPQIKWLRGNALAAVQITDTNICKYEYSEMILELLAKPEVYARIDIDTQQKLNGLYSHKLFEVFCLKRGLLEKNPLVSTEWYELEALHKLLNTASKKTYATFGNLNRLVLKPAIENIKNNSDILPMMEFRKVGKRVVAVRFKLTLQKVKKIAAAPNQSASIIEGEYTSFTDTPEYIIVHQEFRVTKPVTDRFFADHKVEYIREKIEICKAAIKTGSIKTSAARFFVKAMEDDYQPAPVQPSLLPPADGTGVDRRAEIQSQHANALEDQLMKREHVYSQIQRNAYIASLGAEEKEALLVELKNVNPLIKSIDQPMAGYLLIAKIPGYASGLQKERDKVTKQVNSVYDKKLREFDKEASRETV